MTTVLEDDVVSVGNDSVVETIDSVMAANRLVKVEDDVVSVDNHSAVKTFDSVSGADMLVKVEPDLRKSARKVEIING